MLVIEFHPLSENKRLLVPRKPVNFQNYDILLDTLGGTVLSRENQTEASRPGKFLTNFVSELSFPSFQNPTARAVFIL